MKNTSLPILVAALAALSMPQTADAFTSRGGAKVNPVGSGLFEVVPKAGGIGRDYWCAAADYAQRELKAPWSAKLYVARGLGPSETTRRKSAAQFTLDAQQAAAGSAGGFHNINSLKPGESMKVSQAFSYCHQLQTTF
ncbi:hypothetical protein RSK20926_02549 [Roseobacter sp. SK209-2-6]|uniref:hypothetical protein n=1 Tax=Roseobacter sp. SK209-2-6 TaxID=388739 RepID=UPI0000F3EDC3|nr:hypothetical protein [Roseobacter sp. SK209-2-6]EBA16648.1 hypothetical protein RSK20926_02549 [Roseobacter sp. SK209-2-6]